MIDEALLRSKIGWTPHERQLEVLASSSRDIVICAGRRFGKSAICAYLALLELLEDNRKIWIVSPTYDLSQKVFDYLVKWFLRVAPSQAGNISIRPNPKIKTARGSTIECKSAENPTGLLGEEVNLLIVDEASRIPKRVWETYLFPVTASREGRSLFISTPHGKNWFYEKFNLEKQNGGSFHFESKDNPTFPIGEWHRAIQMLPEAVFNQEYRALFLDDASQVFRGVRNQIDANALKGPILGHRYVMGVDLARYNDFTVLVVLDTFTHRVSALDRFRDVAWAVQRQRIETLAKKYSNALIYVDSTGAGDPIAEELRRMGLNVEDYKFSNASKERLIEKLSLYFEQRAVFVPPDETLLDELESFGLSITESGNIRYEAPSGGHDDCVIALALAVWGLSGPEVRHPARLVSPSKKIIRYHYT